MINYDLMHAENKTNFFYISTFIVRTATCNRTTLVSHLPTQLQNNSCFPVNQWVSWRTTTARLRGLSSNMTYSKLHWLVLKSQQRIIYSVICQVLCDTTANGSDTKMNKQGSPFTEKYG